jgi:hypothetical protein
MSALHHLAFQIIESQHAESYFSCALEELLKNVRVRLRPVHAAAGQLPAVDHVADKVE